MAGVYKRPETFPLLGLVLRCLKADGTSASPEALLPPHSLICLPSPVIQKCFLVTN